MPRVLGIYVKRPQEGHVKTRLAATLGTKAATDFYRAFLHDLTGRFRQTADRRFLCFSPNTPEAEAWFRDLGGEDYELWPQPDGSLEPRLTNFCRFAQEQQADQTVVIGSDSPTLPLDYVEQAFECLRERDCVLGPATDGGYYLVGMQTPLPIFERIDWSSPRVFSQTLERISRIQATLGVLPPWYDVDTSDDLELLRGHLEGWQLAKNPLISSLIHTRNVLDLLDNNL